MFHNPHLPIPSRALAGTYQAMIMFPEVQAQAQKELDTVVSTAALPSAKYFDAISYVRGVMKESLRCEVTFVILLFEFFTD